MRDLNWGIEENPSGVPVIDESRRAGMAFRIGRMVAAALPGGRNEWILLLTGINLMLLHFILVQHLVVAIRHDESAVILFSLSFFSGISLGYALSQRFSARWVRRMLPVFLAAQMFIILFAHPAAYALSRDVGQWAAEHDLPRAAGDWLVYLLAYGWIMLGATSLYSVFLPAIIIQEAGRLRRCYSMEVAGSLLGLLLIPLLGAFSHTALLAAYCLAFFGIAFFLGTRWPVLSLLAAMGLLFIGGYTHWDQQGARWVYAQRYEGKGVKEVVYSRYTPYQKIEVVALQGDEYMLLLNGKRQFARGSHFTYSYFVAEYPARLLDAPKVCLLGCGSMSTVGRIGDMVSSITIVDIDPAVFAASRRFLQKYNRLDELHNWTFLADDAKHFLANGRERFDLILHDIPPARSRQTALTYTAEFFASVKKRLTPGGIFSISALNSGGDSGYGRKMLATLAHVFDHYFVLEYRGSYYFCGGGPAMIEPDERALRKAIDHDGKRRVRVLSRSAVNALARGTTIITTNNVGDLIYD